ncbi:MAG: FliM/FliN family flagellar motor switch protein [Sphingomonadales bacterium]|nr:FliM/FliN family flagellar motor switch protein [Sphingomonadales bacterium]
MAFLNAGDNVASVDLQRSIELDSAVSLIVMGAPLYLAGVLVDMRRAMAVLAAIEPGTVLPVAVARAVPLLLGGLAVASGTVGAADDRIAIQITTAF